MSTITQNSSLLTLINVFTVAPERQQELVDALIRGTENTVRTFPGFVSANIHKSADGVRVINYAQWESKEAFAAFQQDHEANANVFKEAAKIAEHIDYHIYTVEHVATKA